MNANNSTNEDDDVLMPETLERLATRAASDTMYPVQVSSFLLKGDKEKRAALKKELRDVQEAYMLSHDPTAFNAWAERARGYRSSLIEQLKTLQP